MPIQLTVCVSDKISVTAQTRYKISYPQIIPSFSATPCPTQLQSTTIQSTYVQITKIHTKSWRPRGKIIRSPNCNYSPNKTRTKTLQLTDKRTEFLADTSN